MTFGINSGILDKNYTDLVAELSGATETKLLERNFILDKYLDKKAHDELIVINSDQSEAIPPAGGAPAPPRDGIIDISDAGSVLKPNHNPPQPRPAGQNRSPHRNRNQRRPDQTGYPTQAERPRPVAPAGPPDQNPNNPLPNSGIGATQGRPPRRDGAAPRSRSNSRSRMRQPRGPVIKPLTTAGANRVIRTANTNTMRIIPLGGSNGIGEKNMIVFEYNNDIIIIDAGIQFPDADMPGIDYIICDTTYLEENRDRVRAFVVTHGHEDHIGGFPYIWPKFPVPIYTAPLTAGFIKAKFEEHGILGADFRIIQPGDKVQIGAFTVEPVRMTHSIPDILGLAITTPAGLIFHATDWRIDFTPAFGEATDFAKLTELANRGVMCMLSDSTNVMEPGFTMSEQVVSKALLDIFTGATGRIIVASFSSRIDRIQHVATACAKTGRRLFLAGRSMERNANIAMELGYLKVPQGVMGDIRSIGNLPDHKVVVMSTGSQGEEGSALVRMASGEHRHVHIKRGDTVVVSAKAIPGNEKGIDQTINNLYKEGAEVITNKDLDIHSSGHANREETKLLLALVKPKYLIPIHGDYRRFVEHAKLAATIGVPLERSFILENGRVVEFEDGNGRITDERVPVGSVLIDGSGVGDIGEIVLRDRQTMARDGVFLVILTIQNRTGKLVSSPDIISRGFVYMKESEELIGGARAIARRLHAQTTARGSFNLDGFKKALRDDISEYLFEKTQRRPMVISAVIQV